MRIVLASASPRRRELLSQIGLDFEIVVSNVEEVVTSTVPCEVVEELSVQKAENVLALMLEMQGQAALEEMDVETWDKQQSRSVLVIGADTIVACDGQILGKPKDAEDAKRMLRMLQGREHEVYTGVTVLYINAAEGMPVTHAFYEAIRQNQIQQRTFHETTKVFFCPMSEEEIEVYVATGDPLDKAGAYGIQGICARYIQGIEGDYNNVVGLPVGRLYQEIKDWLQ